MIRRLLPLGAVALAAACARPDPQAFWTAMAAADPTAALAAAGTDHQRRSADALQAALVGGSTTAAADLIALGADTGAGEVRDWARLLLLHLLRVEGQWPRLANLRQAHPELDLPPDHVPAGTLQLPRADVAPPDAPLRLAWLEHDTGLPMVEGRLAGGSGTATLPIVLDTGAALCVVTAALAERLGVRFLSDEPLPVTGVAGQTASGRAAVLPELALGPWTLRDLPIAVLPTLGMDDEGVSALIGWDVLQHVVVELSPHERTIVVDRSNGRGSGGERNLVLLTEPLVRLQHGDAPLLLLLDTGAVFTYVSRAAARRLGLATKPAGPKAYHGVGGATEIDVDLVDLTLRCGKTLFTCGDVPCHERGPTPRGLPRIDGGLGMDLLSAVRVVIDGPARTLTMQGN